MDKSKEYIKMCDCPEIQGQWKPKEGDYYYPKGDEYDKGISKDDEVRIISVSAWVEDTVHKIWHRKHARAHGSCHKSEHVWLPRQDQIQAMLGYGIGAFVNDLYDFCVDIEMFSNPDNLPNSMEQLWLAFLFKEKYNKVWDSKRQCWIKDISK